MNPEDPETFLARILAGDLDEGDPQVAARLQGDQALVRRLLELRRLEAATREILAPLSPDSSGPTPPGVEAADRALVDQSLVDQSLVDQSLVDRVGANRAVADGDVAGRAESRPTARLHWGMAAAVLVAGLVWWWGGWSLGRSNDGSLGSHSVIRIEREGARRIVHISEQLPPGGEYHLQLEVAGMKPLEATTESADWHLPQEWNEALQSATKAQLIVEVRDSGGLSVVHTITIE